MPPTTVQVALIGDPQRPFTALSQAEREKPWAERPKVELEVDDAETVAAFMTRALIRLGVEPPNPERPHHNVELALYDEREARGYARSLYALALLDDAGRVSWGIHDMQLVRFGELVRAANEGVLAGDPTRIHLLLREGIGDGVPTDWPTLLQAYEVVRETAAHIAALGGATITIKLVFNVIRERLGKGREVAEKEAPRLDRRNGDPHSFFIWLADGPRDLERLAQWLDSSPADTRAMLELFGFAQGDDGLWHPEGDEAGKLLAQIFREALWYGNDPTEADKKEFRDRIDAFLRTGEMPERSEPDWDDIPSWEEIERKERSRKLRIIGSIAAGSFLAGRFLSRRRKG